MNNSSQNRLSKVELEHVNFKKEIKNRKLLSSLNSFELEILREIVYNSLKFPLQELCFVLHVAPEVITPFLFRLKEVGLINVQEDTILVDKDMRKYFELQLMKFDPAFKPNIDYVQTIFQQVPIHLLPIWFSLPKNTDDIFLSIIEKHLLTPKSYSKYLQEVVFENTKQEGIVRDVLSAEEYSLSTAFLKKKYQLEENTFIECMLYLEYSLMCFCIYVETENGFEERVAPLHEWKTWLQFQRDTHCSPLDEMLIQKTHKKEFGFVEEMSKILMNLTKGNPLSQDLSLPLNDLLSTLFSLSLIEKKGEKIHMSVLGGDWLSKKPQEKALTLYRHRMKEIRNKEIFKFTDKDIREVEKSLKRVWMKGWVLLEDFCKGIYTSIGDAEPVMLKRKGKNWSFSLPSYNDEERAFISHTIMGFLFEAGITATGEIEGKPCFSLTTFGCTSIGD